MLLNKAKTRALAMLNNSVLINAQASVFLLTIMLLLLHGCSFAPAKKARESLALVQTLAGAGEIRFGEVFGIVVDKNGTIFFSDGANGKIWRVEQNGVTNPVTDKLNTPSGLALDKDGHLIVADAGSHTIKKVNPTSGDVSVIAGVENKSGFVDGSINTALFHSPVGVAVGNDNRIIVADSYNDKIRIIENGLVSTLAGSKRGFADGSRGLEASFDTPCGVAVTTDGEILVADTGNHRIRKITRTGAVLTFAGTGEWGAKNGLNSEATFAEPIGISIDDFGAIYVADAGTNSIRVFGRHPAPFWETISEHGRGTIDGNLSQVKFNRPVNIAVEPSGKIFVADSANKIVRVIESEHEPIGRAVSPNEAKKLFLSDEEMRRAGEPRWTYNPPNQPRDVAGTFGEVRGVIKQPGDEARFHNGLDIAGALGETARFIRTEKVLRPLAADNFGSLRELLRLPTIGYIHIRLGRDGSETPFADDRFLFDRDVNGKLSGIRVPRGAKFEAGEAVGTLNPMNHVHLIAGETGSEINAFAALELPGVKDTVAPKIEKVTLYNENWQEYKSGESLRGKVRIVVRAFDQMDGNNARRRLGVYQLGYQILTNDNSAVSNFREPITTISFERLPENESGANLVYAFGSQSGYTPETVFNYIVTNIVRDGDAAREDFLDTAKLTNGDYKIRVFARDFFGNQTVQEIAAKISN